MSLFDFNPFDFWKARPEPQVEDTVIHLECDIEESISDWIEQFMRLSKHGEFKRARLLFDDVLRPHLSLFPVAAEYAHFLLEQGNFGKLENFLTDYLQSRPSFDRDEIQLLRLLRAFARLHTGGLLNEAFREVVDANRCLPGLTIGAADDVQRQILVIELRIIYLKLSTSTSDVGKLDSSWTTRDDSVREVLYEQYTEWMRLYSEDFPWDVRCLPNLILLASETVDWDSIQRDLRTIVLRCSDDEAAILATIAILDAWCEALLQKVWKWRMQTDGHGVGSCIESCTEFCMNSIEKLFASYYRVATDTVPLRYQVRLLLHRRDYRLWQLLNQNGKVLPLRTCCLNGGNTSLWALLEVAKKAEDFRVQYQCLGWLSLELNPSALVSAMDRDFDLWRSSTNTPSYLSILDNWIKRVNRPRSQRSTIRPISKFFSRMLPELNADVANGRVNFIRDEITLFSVMKLSVFDFHSHRGPRSSRIYDVREVANLSHSGTMALGNISAGVHQLIRSVLFEDRVYGKNTHGLTDLLVTKSYTQLHKDPPTWRVAARSTIKRSVVLKLTAAYLPPAAIAALKLTSRVNFETIEYPSNVSLDSCARFAIRRHLEESQEAPLRYRCAYCKALYPASMFERLSTPDVTKHGGIGRVCKWHSGRYDRVVGRMGPKAWVKAANVPTALEAIFNSPAQTSRRSVGMLRNASSPRQAKLDAEPHEAIMSEQWTVERQAEPEIDAESVVESIEKVCMHCGRVQTWEPCSCNCETCWYKDVPCTTTYVDDEMELLKGEGVARAVD